MNILPIAMIAIFGVSAWFLILRPARARASAAQRVVNEIRVGDAIMTTAGMFGTITQIDEQEVKLEIADGVVVRMLKPAIAKLVEPAISMPAESAQVVDISESK